MKPGRSGAYSPQHQGRDCQEDFQILPVVHGLSSNIGNEIPVCLFKSEPVFRPFKDGQQCIRALKKRGESFQDDSCDFDAGHDSSLQRGEHSG